MATQQKAVVLLSGGLDSSTTLAIAKNRGFALHAMSFHYGQRHEAELAAAERVAQALSVVEHTIVGIDLRTFGGSALTSDIPVPKNRHIGDMAHGIPVTYVPARNTIFLAYAMAWAEVLRANHIFIGVNSIDYSGYPDCRSEFIAAFQAMANLATKAGVEGAHLCIEAPLINMTKAEIIREGLRLGVDYSMTVSCYDADADGKACGVCDSCQLRRKGFEEASVADPTRYRT